MDILPTSAPVLQNNKDNLDLSGLLIPNAPVFQGDLECSSVINLASVGKLDDSASEKVKIDIKQKGNKQWKRLARGDLSYPKISDDEISMMGRGKQIREMGAHLFESRGMKRLFHMNFQDSVLKPNCQKETLIEPAIKKRSISLSLEAFAADTDHQEDLDGSSALAVVARQPLQQL